MNDVYTYPEYGNPDEVFLVAVKAEMQRILGRLASGSVSHMELLCLPANDTPLQAREIIETALNQLRQSGDIRIADTEPTSHQNLVLAYEITAQPSVAS